MDRLTGDRDRLYYGFNLDALVPAHYLVRPIDRVLDLSWLHGEMAFRRMGMMVVQIQLTKSIEAPPLTRDYMAHWEQAHAPVDTAPGRRLKSVS